MSKPLGVERAFCRLPECFIRTLSTGGESRQLRFSLAFAGVILSGVVEPVIEGIYFREFLLPRLPRLGPTGGGFERCSHDVSTSLDAVGDDWPCDTTPARRISRPVSLCPLHGARISGI